LTSLEFDAELRYEETSAGILVPIRLTHGDRSVELSGRLDTGTADCIFRRFLCGYSRAYRFRSPEAISNSGRFVRGTRVRIDY
jgi:hypothetical protein